MARVNLATAGDIEALRGTYPAMYVVTTLTSAGIQAKIDAAFTAGGGTVFCPAGTYTITAPVVVKSKVTLAGAGRGTVLSFVNAANFDCIVMGSGAGMTDMHVRDLCVQGDGDKVLPASQLAAGIVIGPPGNNGAHNSSVTDCWIKDVSGFGIEASQGSTDLIISRNHIEGCGNAANSDGHAISTESVNRMTISNNTIRNCRMRGIEVFSGTSTNSQDVTISGNVIHTVRGAGIAVFGSSSGLGFVRNVTVANNSINAVLAPASNVADGIWIGDFCDNTTVIGNTIKGVGKSGIYLSQQLAPGSWIKRVSVIGNVIWFADEWGIRIDSGSNGHCVIQGNQIRGSFRDGIYAETCNYLTIASNMCTDNGRRGTAPGSNSGIVLGNILRSSVMGNVCRDTASGASRTQTHGIMSYGTSDYNAVVGNVCHNNVTAAISLSGANNQLANNITT